MEECQKEDRLLITSIANAVAKSIFYIGICITISLLFSSCQVDSQTILQCEDSCGGSGIKEVTAWSCECGEKETISETPWVIPR